MASTYPQCDRALILAGVCALCITASACRQPELPRGHGQAQAGGPVTIAAAWPWESRTTLLYGQGLQMAVEETNAAGGSWVVRSRCCARTITSRWTGAGSSRNDSHRTTTWWR